MLPPANNIGFLLQRLASIMARQSDQVLQEQLGIGFSQFKILMILHWKPETKQRYIADKLSQTEASISRQIKLLEKQGLITVHVSKENRRQHMTRLTPKGLRVIEKALDVLNSYYAPMFSGLSDKQKEQLLGTLNIMHDYVCRTEKPLRED